MVVQIHLGSHMGHALVRRSPLQGDPDRFDTDVLHAEVGHAGEPLGLGPGAGGFDSRPRYCHIN